MKNFITILATIFLLQNTSAAVLIGHRGSYWGVENAAEAFENGAKAGFNGLETDVKVTKDNQFICCHDNDLSRFGHGSVTIEGSTLAELKALDLSQTRGGKSYSGKICTISEYLDICNEYNVFPVIELKWAKGLNSNDCSNIPALVQLVKSKNIFDKAVFLTSMKPCLEFIRKNYPDANMQFLCYARTMESNLDWCVKNRADVDSEVGTELTAEVVKKYHDNGLKVNVWTVNTVQSYQDYRAKGVDMFTVDYLDLTGVLEPDYEVSLQPLWKKSLAETDYLTNTTSQRSMAVFGGELFIPDTETKKIAVVDEKTGNLTQTIQTQLENGLLSCIRFTNDGVMLLGSTNGANDRFSLYSCDKNGVTTLVFDSLITGFGQADYFDVRGELNSTDGGFLVAASDQGKAIRIPFKNGIFENAVLFNGHKKSSSTATHATIHSDSAVIIATTPRTARKLYALDGSWSKSFGSPAPSNTGVDGVCFPLNGRYYYASVETRMGTFKLFDITYGVDKPILFGPTTPELGNATNAAATAPICAEVFADYVLLTVMSTNNGIAAYRLGKEQVSVVSPKANSATIFAKNGVLTVENANGRGLSIFDVMGRKILSQKLDNDLFTIENLPQKQLLILKIDQEIFKVIL